MVTYSQKKWFFVNHPEHRIPAKPYVLSRVKFFQSYVRTHGSRPMLGTMTSTVVIIVFVMCHGQPFLCHASNHVLVLGNSPVTRFSRIKARMACVEIARNPMKIKLDSPKEISAP